MADDRQIQRSDPDVQEAIQDARALVTARMQVAAGGSGSDLESLFEEISRKALAAPNPQRAIIVHLATLAALASATIDTATALLLPDDAPVAEHLQFRDDLRARIFSHLDQTGHGEL